MKKSKVVHDKNLQLGPAGLVMLGEMARAIELDSVARSINKGNPQITIADILRTMIGLLAQGKADFDHYSYSCQTGQKPATGFVRPTTGYIFTAIVTF